MEHTINASKVENVSTSNVKKQCSQVTVFTNTLSVQVETYKYKVSTPKRNCQVEQTQDWKGLVIKYSAEVSMKKTKQLTKWP